MAISQSADFTFTFTMDPSIDSICAPKIAFSDFFFYVDQLVPDANGVLQVDPNGFSITDDPSSGLSQTVIFPGDGVFDVEIGADDTAGQWFPRTAGQITVGTGAQSSTSAGPNQSISNGARTVQLAGTAPPASTTAWQEVSGPGAVTFGSGSPTTTAKFSAPGIYLLRLIAVAGASGTQSSADVTIDVYDHYRVELESWIPQATLVDPYHPVPVPAAIVAGIWPISALDVPAVCRPSWKNATITIASDFRGDAHTTYGTGSKSRILSWLEFDWDGVRLANPTDGDVPAHSTRDWKITNLNTGAIKTCTQGGTEIVPNPSTFMTGTNTFQIQHQHATDLVTPAPPLEATLNGTLSGSTLTMTSRATTFPSHGYRITKNGSVLATRTFENASCVETLGLAGVTNLTAGLLSYDLYGAFNVALNGRKTAEQISPCS